MSSPEKKLMLVRGEKKKKTRLEVLESCVWVYCVCVCVLTLFNPAWWQGKEKVKPRGNDAPFIPMYSRKSAMQWTMWSNSCGNTRLLHHRSAFASSSNHRDAHSLPLIKPRPWNAWTLVAKQHNGRGLAVARRRESDTAFTQQLCKQETSTD